MKPLPPENEVIYLESEITEKTLKHSFGQKWSLYKISKEDFMSLAERQGNMCAVCKVDATGLEHRLCVDHDHYTNEIRGLLCHDCNTATGWIHDRPEVAEQLAHYLRTSGTGIFIPVTGG